MPDEYSAETELLKQLANREWTLYAVGDPSAAPGLIVAVKPWEFVSDVVALRGQDRVTAYRTPLTFGSDPLRASHVIWDYVGHAAYALGLVLRQSNEFGAPYSIPPECRIPALERRPFTLRPPRHAQTPHVRQSPYVPRQQAHSARPTAEEDQ